MSIGIFQQQTLVAAVGPTIIAHDDFAGDAATGLHGRGMILGGPWVMLDTSSTDHASVTGGHLQWTSAHSGGAAYRPTAQPTTAIYAVAARLSQASTGDTLSGFPIVAGLDNNTSNNYYNNFAFGARFHGLSQRYTGFSRNNGTLTQNGISPDTEPTWDADAEIMLVVNSTTKEARVYLHTEDPLTFTELTGWGRINKTDPLSIPQLGRMTPQYCGLVARSTVVNVNWIKGWWLIDNAGALWA
jgi:hypothetical protein